MQMSDTDPHRDFARKESQSGETNPITLRVLVAEDNYANRLLAETLLTRKGHSVTFAENGKLAVSLCKYQKFDLIIMDIQMPIMDGVTAVKILRQRRGPNRETPIFALTAYSSKDEADAYRLAGMQAVLSKPLSPGDITRAWSHLQNTEPKTPRAPVMQHIHDVDVPVIDETIIGRLRDAADLPALQRLLNAFWASADVFIIEMEEALPRLYDGHHTELDAFRKNAHAIKGASINVGALRASRLAAQLQNSPPEECEFLFAALKRCLILTRPLLKHAIKHEIVTSSITETMPHQTQAT